MTVSLLPILDRFLEAAAVAQKRRVLGALERKLHKAMRKAFRVQGKAFVAGFADLRGKFSEAVAERDWLRVFNGVASDTFDLFLEPLETYVPLALIAGAEAVISELGEDVAFNLRNPRAVAYVRAHGAELVTGINDTTRDQMRTLITQAVDEGWSYTRTADAIKERFDGFAGLKPQAHIVDRATLVAVTETGNAYETGSAIVVADLQDAGLKMEKAWLTVSDDKVSDGCQSNQAEGWIPFDQAFGSGHMQPLRFPGCRCSALYRRKPS